MKKKKIIYLVIIIVIIVIVITCVHFKKQSKEKEEYELVIYQTSTGGPYDPTTYCCKTNKVYKTIKTETKDAEVVTVSDNDKYILIKDGKLKLLNNDTDKLIDINLETDYKLYIILTLDNDSILKGIAYYREREDDYFKKVGFYNIELGKKLYDDGYYDVFNLKDEDTLYASKDKKRYVLNLNKEEVLEELEDIE